MHFSRRIVRAILLILVTASMLSLGGLPKVYAPSSGGNTYNLNAVPASAQEGTPVSLVLTVTLGIIVLGSTTYSFRFHVRDPAGATFQTPQPVNHTTTPSETQFSVIVNYTSAQFPGINSLVGTYVATVDQLAPSVVLNVAGPTSFTLTSTDNNSYERTQTVNIQASGYNASETVNVIIQTQTTSTIVFSSSTTASSAGVVTASWRIPPNATIDNYLATLTGTTTHKSPPDNETFGVRVAIMSISGISMSKSTYQRTDVMQFSVQPKYPDLTIPTSGVGLMTLTNPVGGKVTLTATYDSNAQTFNATYQTSISNRTGTWTVSLGAHGYSDAYGNTGPGTTLTNTPRLTIASLSVTVSTNTNIAVGQQLAFNVTVTYPDGTLAPAATTRAYLVYSGTPAINDTIPLVYDSTLGHWVGTYTAKSGDTGGLWSLIVLASDSSNPPDSGSTTRAITIQNTATGSPSASFPLFYFGIFAAIIAGLLLATLLVFRRRRVSHTSLKIDLDAVHSEAGRIENQEFFQTIKEQVRKDLDEKK
jgi:hypothetical protein